MSYQFGHVERDERIDLAAEEPLGEPPRRGPLPTPLLTALVMAVFAGGLWFAYVEGTHHAAAPGPAAAVPAVAGPDAPAVSDTVPLIRADPQPMKVKPERPGGMPVPDRDKLIYNERPGGPPVERLLPPPEQPQPRPAPILAAPIPAATPPPPVAAAPLPSVPPAGSLPALPRPKATAPQPARTASADSPAPGPSEIKGGHIRIQLASLRTPEEARTEWQRLKRSYPDLLGRLTADAVRADLGERGTWYRIEAGSFAELGPAQRLCRELKERHLGCSIVR